jgi:hypothetical protein
MARPKTNRVVPMYPRVTLENKNWIAKMGKYASSESEFFDKVLTYARKNIKVAEIKGMFGVAKTRNGISAKATKKARPTA